MSIKSPNLSLDFLRPTIASALHNFRSLPPDRWFREVLLCLLTPQSSPYRAEQAMVALEDDGFFAGNMSREHVASILRSPDRYVRFHNVKADRLLLALKQREEIEDFLKGSRTPFEEREFLVRTVNGFGYKEASHALRNIGRANLAILDRHILRSLHQVGALSEIPRSLNPRRYLEIEAVFASYADSIGEHMDVLDLFFWAQYGGGVFK